MIEQVPDDKTIQRNLERVRRHGEMCYCDECIRWRVLIFVGAREEEAEKNERNRASGGPRHTA
jgi:hypothetical protein